MLKKSIFLVLKDIRNYVRQYSWDVPDAKKFILSGDWSLAANSGTITKLYVNFTKVLADGTRWHSHEFINFKTNDEDNKVLLDPDRNLSVSGIVD